MQAHKEPINESTDNFSAAKKVFSDPCESHQLYNYKTHMVFYTVVDVRIPAYAVSTGLKLSTSKVSGLHADLYTGSV